VRRLIPWVYLVLAAALVRLPSYLAPIGRDSGVFLYHGARILAGEVPYRDLWDHKPPGIYYLDAWGSCLAGWAAYGSWSSSGRWPPRARSTG